MTTPDSHRRLCNLLVEGGTRVGRALFLKRFNELRPPGHDPDTWTEETFLLANKNRILSTRMGKDRKCALFPAEAKDSFLQKSDLDVFCFLLTEICELEYDLLTALNQLRCMHAELVHAGDAVISDRKCEDYLKKLKYIIKKCQAEISDKRFNEEMEKIFEQADSDKGHMSLAVQKMKTMRESVPSYSLEHLQKNDFTDGDKLDIVIEKIGYIDARLHFSSFLDWSKEDVHKKEEEKMDETHVSAEPKHERAKPQSGLLEKL